MDESDDVEPLSKREWATKQERNMWKKYVAPSRFGVTSAEILRPSIKHTNTKICNFYKNFTNAILTANPNKNPGPKWGPNDK